MFARSVAGVCRQLKPVLASTRRSLPVCCVQTNLGDTEIPTDFQQGLGRVLAHTLNKSEKVTRHASLDG